MPKVPILDHPSGSANVTSEDGAPTNTDGNVNCAVVHVHGLKYASSTAGTNKAAKIEVDVTSCVRNEVVLTNV